MSDAVGVLPVAIAKEIFDFIGALVGVLVADLNQFARVLRREQEVAHQVGAGLGGASQAVDEVLDQLRHIFVMVPARSDKLTDGRMTKVLRGRIFSSSSRSGCRSVALFEEMIQAVEMLDVGGEVVEEHSVKQDADDLRQGRHALTAMDFVLLFIAASHTDGEDLVRPETDDGAERLLQADAAIAEIGSSLGNFQGHRLEDQRNGGGGTDMVDGDFGGDGYLANALPYWNAFRPLNEEIALAGTEVGRGDGNGVEISALDISLDVIAIEMRGEKAAERSGIQQIVGVATAGKASEREVEYPGDGIVGLREEIAVEDVGGLEAGPHSGDGAGDTGETEEM